MQTKMLVEAVKAKGVKKWAIVAPNYEYGQSAAANFKKLIKVATPDAEIVGEQFPALGKIDAGATVAALENVKPDGIFNVLFGADLTVFVREGNTRGLFEKRTVVEPADRRARVHDPARRGDAGGLDHHRLSLGADHGRPRTRPSLPPTRPSSTTRRGSARCSATSVGYMMKDMLDKAGSTDTDKLLAALNDLKSNTIAGPVTMRALDHQSTLGAWVGETTLKDKKGTMKNWKYEDGAKYVFPEAEVKAARKQ